MYVHLTVYNYVCTTLIVFVCTIVAERGVVCRVVGWVTEKRHIHTNKFLIFNFLAPFIYSRIVG